MLTAIVPEKSSIRKNICRFLKDRIVNFFIVTFVIIITVTSIAGACSKEVRRRQLFRISCDNDLLCSEYCTDCILREDLRSLIKNHHIELIRIGIQKIGY